jgi:hypothetical protein
MIGTESPHVVVAAVHQSTLRVENYPLRCRVNAEFAGDLAVRVVAWLNVKAKPCERLSLFGPSSAFDDENEPNA